VSARPRVRALLGAGPACAALLLLAGCGKQSTLDPESPPARDISTLWWWMLVAAAIVLLGAVVLLLLSWVRRRREGLPFVGKSESVSTGLVLLFGIGIPIVSLVTLFVLANLVVAKDTDAPSAGSTRMTVEVTGRQWFWDVRYPGTRAITANEIHIPARTRVDLVGRTADVIHSFWVPQLNRKIDMVPGRTNRVLLYADKPGRYRGQCAEFCGLQHTHMGVVVVADPPDVFRRWLNDAARPARRPAAPEERLGREVFLSEACASCHTIRGTAARGRVGPDLTHLATRRTLAGLTIPNTRSYLRAWIRDPQHVKPGNKMPGLNLSGAQRGALVDYLESLR
jgi:cytochrome c oxidase subunit II